MNLYYSNKTRSYVPFSNFGDELNGWLWPKLLPEVFDNQESQATFVGFGTLLNENLPKFKQTVVFGTGHGFGKPPIIDDTWTIYCVRGPLTAKALNLSETLAIADTAILTNRVYPFKQIKKKYKVAFIPYAWEMEDSPDIFLEVCQDLDYECIDPRWDVARVLQVISESERIITSAMHGAIIADALRVPWISVKSNAGIPDFKWMDFCQSLELEYKANRFHRFHRFSKKNIIFKHIEVKRMKLYLKKLVQHGQFELSTEPILNDRLDQLEKKIALFKSDLSSGKFQ